MGSVLKNRILPTGRTLVTAFDDLGRPKGLNGTLGTTTSYVDSIQYGASGQPKKQQWMAANQTGSIVAAIDWNYNGDAG